MAKAEQTRKNKIREINKLQKDRSIDTPKKLAYLRKFHNKEIKELARVEVKKQVYDYKKDYDKTLLWQQSLIYILGISLFIVSIIAIKISLV